MQLILILIGNIQQIAPLLALQPNLEHGFLLNLLAEPAILLLIILLNITLLIDLITDILDDPRHLLIHDTLILFGRGLPGVFLIILKVALLPSPILADLR